MIDRQGSRSRVSVFSLFSSLLFSSLLFLSSVASAGTVQLTKTGQKTCYDATGAAIVCAGTGQDGASKELPGQSRGLSPVKVQRLTA